MLRKYIYSILILLGLFNISCSDLKQKQVSQREQNAQISTSPTVKGTPQTDINTPPNIAQTGNIPPKVYKVLKYVLENGEPMDGYVGGRIFQNRERHLPLKDKNGGKIKYQEWDVNPKRSGQNRGTQRLVTGSDGSAWYSDDHYQTFKEVTKQ